MQSSNAHDLLLLLLLPMLRGPTTASAAAAWSTLVQGLMQPRRGALPPVEGHTAREIVLTTMLSSLSP